MIKFYNKQKYKCPECGEMTFVRYYNTDDKSLLPANVGRCDREINCAYFYKYTDYFKDNNIEKSTVTSNEVIDEITRDYIFNKEAILYHKKRTFDNYRDFFFKSNPFLTSLAKVFTEDTIYHKCLEYNTFPSYQNDIMFIYMSYSGEIKVIKNLEFYETNDQLLVKRNKNVTPFIHNKTFSTNYVIGQNFKIDWCLYGEHLTDRLIHKENEGKKIIIVESEKTAFIMSLYYPEYIWCATGGLRNLHNYGACQRSIFIPDADIDVKNVSCADKWRAKIAKTNFNHFDNQVIDFHMFCTPTEIQNHFEILDLQLVDSNKVKYIMSELLIKF